MHTYNYTGVDTYQIKSNKLIRTIFAIQHCLLYKKIKTKKTKRDVYCFFQLVGFVNTLRHRHIARVDISDVLMQGTRQHIE